MGRSVTAGDSQIQDLVTAQGVDSKDSDRCMQTFEVRIPRRTVASNREPASESMDRPKTGNLQAINAEILAPKKLKKKKNKKAKKTRKDKSTLSMSKSRAQSGSPRPIFHDRRFDQDIFNKTQQTPADRNVT